MWRFRMSAPARVHVQIFWASLGATEKAQWMEIDLNMWWLQGKVADMEPPLEAVHSRTSPHPAFLTPVWQPVVMCCWMVALRHRPSGLGGIFVLSKHFLVEERSQISLICSCVASRRIFQKETEAWCWWGLGWNGKVYGYLGLTWSPQDLRVSESYSASTRKLFSTTSNW